jgi:hypothetical protein
VQHQADTDELELGASDERVLSERPETARVRDLCRSGDTDVARGRAQQPAMPVIGYLGGESPGLYANRLRAFHQGLTRLRLVKSG